MVESEGLEIQKQLEKIHSFFREHEKVAVAFSGGVDSAVLLMLARRYAKNVKAYFVQSQFQPPFEQEDAIATASALQTRLEVITVDILSFARVVQNQKNRCYYCKKEIFSVICRHAQQDGFDFVLDGTNASDDISDRPGFLALKELQVLSPLRLCGFTKAHIRHLAKENHLAVADKPSYACLATRIPTDTMIREDILNTTLEAESAMKKMGFQNFRVRYRQGDAILELGRRDFSLFYTMKDEVYSALSKYYRNIYLDLRERTDE